MQTFSLLVTLAGLPEEIFSQLAIVQGTVVILGKHLVKTQVVFVGFKLSLQHPGLFYLELVVNELLGELVYQP